LNAPAVLLFALVLLTGLAAFDAGRTLRAILAALAAILHELRGRPGPPLAVPSSRDDFTGSPGPRRPTTGRPGSAAPKVAPSRLGSRAVPWRRREEASGSRPVEARRGEP
jgi:hypothetical protein